MGLLADKHGNSDNSCRALAAALVYSALNNLDLPLRVIRNDDGTLTVREPQQVQTDLFWFFENREYATSFLQCMQSMDCEDNAERWRWVVMEIRRQRKVFAKAIERGKIKGPFYRSDIPGEMVYRPHLFVHVGELRYKRKWYVEMQERAQKARMEKRLTEKLEAIACGGILKGKFADFVGRVAAAVCS